MPRPYHRMVVDSRTDRKALCEDARDFAHRLSAASAAHCGNFAELLGLATMPALLAVPALPRQGKRSF